MSTDVLNQFAEAVAEILRPTLEQMIDERLKEINNTQEKEKDEYLTRAEVCKMLKISLPTLHSMVNKGLLRKYKAQGHTIFKASEVERAVILGVTLKYRRS